MIKVFDVVDDGQLAVLVNPETGRIYGYSRQVPVWKPVEDSVTRVVYVDTSPEAFAAELEEGLWYCDQPAGFYRAWRKYQLGYVVKESDTAVITLEGPEQLTHDVQLLVDDNPPATLTTSGAKLRIELKLAPGRHTVRAISPHWGRATMTVYVMPARNVDTAAMNELMQAWNEAAKDPSQLMSQMERMSSIAAQAQEQAKTVIQNMDQDAEVVDQTLQELEAATQNRFNVFKWLFGRVFGWKS